MKITMATPFQNGAPRAKPVLPSLKYPPTPLDAKTLRCAGSKASEGYPPVAKSAEASGFNALAVKERVMHSSTGKVCGLLRRRIRLQQYR
jgi:hypothetical protein